MSKHTPGPYERKGTLVYALTPYTGKINHGHPCDKWAAQVQSQNGQDGASQEECEDVARMFKESPDMLEALKEARSGLHAFCAGATEHTIAKIDSIIRQAEGRE